MENEKISKANSEKRKRKRMLHKSIIKQIEFYFSDSNLTKDRFMGQLIQTDPYVDLSVFLTFNKIRSITTNLKDLVKALKHSEILQLSEDETKVKRIYEIKPKENEDDFTIYVENLPAGAEHDWLRKMFEKFGEIDYISIPRYKHNKMTKGFAFVEFAKLESVTEVLKQFEKFGGHLPTIMAPEQLASITTFVDEQEQEQKESDEFQFETTKVENEGDNDLEKNDEISQNQSETNIVKSKDSSDDKPIKCEKDSKESEQIDSSNEDKKLQKKRKRDSSENEELETNISEKVQKSSKVKEENIEEDSNVPEVKIKKRKCSSIENEEIKPEKKSKLIENSKKEKVENDGDRDVEKQKKKQESSKVKEDFEENPSVQGENIKKRKRSSIEDVESKSEITEKKSKLNENSKEETVKIEEQNVKKQKKKKRKRNRSNKKRQNSAYAELKVLSKKEWKQLRNKYLNLQRERMKKLKDHLARQRFTENSFSNQPSFAVNEETEEKVTPRFQFSPGVILQFQLSSSCSDAKKLKNDFKTNPGVEYVDFDAIYDTGYIRFSDSEHAQRFYESSSFSGTLNMLHGDEEKQYWDKIFKDCETNKMNRKKQKIRGRDKILRRAEKRFGTHMGSHNIVFNNEESNL